MKRQISLLTGERQIGKSTLCRILVTALQQHDVDVSGLLTSQPEDHALEVTEVRGARRYRLTYPFDSEQGIALTHFRMNPEAMRRSTRALKDSFPTQVFLLDEIGPLELIRGEGWVDVFELLQTATYQVAYLVVRPALLGAAVQQIPNDIFTVIHVTHANRTALPQRLVAHLLEDLEKSS